MLWDMDGTLIDSGEYWTDSQREVVEHYGGQWSQAQSLELVGLGLVDIATILRAHLGHHAEVAD